MCPKPFVFPLAMATFSSAIVRGWGQTSDRLGPSTPLPAPTTRLYRARLSFSWSTGLVSFPRLTFRLDVPIMYTVRVRMLMDHIKCLTLTRWLPRQQRLTAQATQNNEHFARSKGVVLCVKQLWLILAIHATIPLR